MEKLGYLWDEFNSFDQKGIRLQVFDAEEDPESDPCHPNIASFHQNHGMAGSRTRAGDILDSCGL